MLSEVQGQAEGVRFLERVVGGHLTSPLLLVGDEGTGRRFSVVQAAKESFSGGDPASPHCLQIDGGIHPDLLTVTADEKAIGVDTMRAIVDQTSEYPALVPSRFVIIDGADRMTLPAADALLKTLEDPPHTTLFFLLAEALEKVTPTVRSRCGVVRYRPLSEAFIVDYLKEIENDPDKALVYARISGGSVGRAAQYKLSGRLALRDRMLALLRIGTTKELSSLFSVVDDLEDDLLLGLRFLEHILRDLVILPHSPERLVNLDQVEALRGLRTVIGSRLERLVEGLRQLQGRMHLKVGLPFHIKAYLASAFAE